MLNKKAHQYLVLQLHQEAQRPQAVQVVQIDQEVLGYQYFQQHQEDLRGNITKMTICFIKHKNPFMKCLTRFRA